MIETACPQMAIIWLEKCRDLDPARPGLMAYIGGVYLMLRCWQAAADAFSQAVADDPQSVESLLGLGTACANMGNLERAIEVLELARKIQNCS